MIKKIQAVFRARHAAAQGPEIGAMGGEFDKAEWTPQIERGYELSLFDVVSTAAAIAFLLYVNTYY
jgi:hypothetical protein